MAYTVTRNFGKSELMQVGEHIAKVTSWKFREYTSPDEIVFKNIMLILENNKKEIAFDTIYQQLEVDETGMQYLVYDEGRMNRYSYAINIEEGTKFNTIEDWLTYLVGKDLIVEIELRNERTRVANIRSVEEGDMPF